MGRVYIGLGVCFFYTLLACDKYLLMHRCKCVETIVIVITYIGAVCKFAKFLSIEHLLLVYLYIVFANRF